MDGIVLNSPLTRESIRIAEVLLALSRKGRGDEKRL
jgi:hypothetical protein